MYVDHLQAAAVVAPEAAVGASIAPMHTPSCQMSTPVQSVQMMLMRHLSPAAGRGCWGGRGW
jgi:hypothetical protein